MDRPGSREESLDRTPANTRTARVVFILAAALTLLPAPLGAQGMVAATQGPSALLALQAARAAYEKGDAAAAFASLRRLRGEFPDSPLVPASLALGIDIALATEDEYLARFFHMKLLANAPRTASAFRASIDLAQYYYRRHAYVSALQYFKAAADNFGSETDIPRKDLDQALLRCAELSLYHGKDPLSAREYFGRIERRAIPPEDEPLYRKLRIRLVWEVLTPALLGVGDANVSCLRVDNDDLWVGTWNGGVARYSVSSGKSDPFPTPPFSRAIEVADRRVWVGTAEGLSWYGKSTGRWGTSEEFQAPAARKVQALKLAAGELYAGTLGDGLFRLGENGWVQVSDGDLPGRFVNCISGDDQGKSLLIGTMNIGLVVLDGKTGEMRTLAEIIPEFTADNVTTVLPDTTGRIWIGTYGEGLFLWSPADGTIRRFTKESGEIGDDWILAICETPNAVYFGSFGGGVSAFLKANGTWKRYGIADGLSSLDITAIAWREPYVYFGTLGAGVCVYNETADGAQL